MATLRRRNRRDSAADQKIRADLGRPETPEETAARKAENSRNYREAKTPNNLVIALVASLGIVLFLVLVVVRANPGATDPIDYAAVAAQAQPGVETPLVTPVLPPGWSANAATLESSADESFTWYIGFVTPENQFLALEQGIDTNAGWFASYLTSATPTGTEVIDGIEWEVYDQRDADDPGNFAYSLTTTVDGTDYLVHGTADDGEFALFASALASEIATNAETGTEG
jgi:hypothetical protein